MQDITTPTTHALYLPTMYSTSAQPVIYIDVLKASASIAYTGFSAGIYIGEISAANSAINLFGRRIELTLAMNYGCGATMEISKKSTFGFSWGWGFVFSLEVK